MHGQTTASAQNGQDTVAQFIGVWRGQFENLPGVDMVISDEDGQLHGGILFYFHSRPDVNSPWTSKSGLPEPIFDLKIEEQSLRFEVSHRRASTGIAERSASSLSPETHSAQPRRAGK
jgi:hypothetical protein